MIEIGQGPPLLLIHGGGGYAAERGPFFLFCPKGTEGVASKNPCIAVVRIPDAGHVHWFDSPGRAAAAINTTLEEVASPPLPRR